MNVPELSLPSLGPENMLESMIDAAESFEPLFSAATERATRRQKRAWTADEDQVMMAIKEANPHGDYEYFQHYEISRNG